VPWSNILFNHVFTERYSDFLLQCKERKEELDLYLLREFTLNYIFEWNKVRGVGHLKTINSFMQLLIFSDLPNIESTKIKKHIIEYEFTYNYIVEYISQILMHFTKNGEFNLLEYFNTVFIKNIDIWGLIMTYSVIIKYLIHKPSDTDNLQLSNLQLQLIDKIKYIMFHYLFEAPLKVIDIDKVALELQNLNSIIENTNINIVKKDLKRINEFKGGSIRKSIRNVRKTRKAIKAIKTKKAIKTRKKPYKK
jgi:general stress protein CsbA